MAVPDDPAAAATAAWRAAVEAYRQTMLTEPVGSLPRQAARAEVDLTWEHLCAVRWPVVKRRPMPYLPEEV